MPGVVQRDFPLFPLQIVALPGEVVPLHIFEDRYKAMMAHCLDSGSEFGIVWMAEDGLREIGCACAIERVLERLDDGRLNLLARGTRPFRVLERQAHLPYPAGVIEFVTDLDAEPDPSVSEAARAAYAELVRRATDREPGDEDVDGMGAYEMAATVDFGPEAKQGLLDLRSEDARLRLVTRLFLAAAKRLDLVDRAQERARSNGKVHIG